MTPRPEPYEPRDVADDLSEGWDALLQDESVHATPAAAALLDVARQLHLADTTPALSAPQRAQIWQDLLREQACHEQALEPRANGHESTRRPRPEVSLVPTPLAEERTRPTPRTRWGRVTLAAAALVLLTLVGGLLAQYLPRHLGEQQEAPAIIPAIDREVESRVVMAGQVTAWPPTDPPYWMSLQRVTLDPGVEEDPGTPTTISVGPTLFLVELGQVTVEADGPVHVTRGSRDAQGPPAVVPAGTPIVLDPGDHLVASSGISLHRRNAGTTPVTLLDFRIGNVEQVHRVSTGRYQRLLPDKVLNTLPPAPAHVAITRIQLQPGSHLLVSDLPGLHMLYVETGTLDLMGARRLGDLEPESWKTLLAGNGLAHFETTTALANRSPEPVSVLIATIVPAP